jgi:hypothetical protein
MLTPASKYQIGLCVKYSFYKNEFDNYFSFFLAYCLFSKAERSTCHT